VARIPDAPPEQARDAGFSLVEMMAALVVLGLIFAAVLGILTTSIKTTRSNRNRVAASNLASRELEITRNAFYSKTVGPRAIQAGLVVNPNPLPGGTAGQTLNVDGVKYTVRRTAAWQSQGATSSPCDGGASGQLQYLHVTVTVSWTNMTGGPVVDNTLLTPQLGTYTTTTGHIRSKLIDRNGKPLEGHTVTATGPSGTSTQVTAEDGCAFFAFLSPGTYTVTVNTAGYTSPTWVSAPTQSVAVTAGTATPANFTYDLAASLAVTLNPVAANFPVPVNVPLSVGNSIITPSGRMSVPGTGAARTLTSVWPYNDGLQLWAGDCMDSDPTAIQNNGTAYWPGATRAAAVTTAPGGSGSTTVALRGVDVRVMKGANPQPGLQVIAVHAVDNGCPGPVTDQATPFGTVGSVISFPVLTDATGYAKASLPYGTWTYKVVSKTPNGSWPSNANDPRAAGNSSVTVTVN
jgi:prepilin-type N-terminal cleavage/methylation domain-containing protein